MRKVQKLAGIFFASICFLHVQFVVAQNSDIKAITDNWKIGIQTWTFRMFTLEEALQKADSAGIKHVEAFWGQALSRGGSDTFGIRLSPGGRASLKSMLQSKGMSLVAMGSISPRSREEWVRLSNWQRNLDFHTSRQNRTRRTGT